MPHSVLPVQWQNASQCRHELSTELRAWLLNADSLTARLRQHYQHFAVKIVQQTWQLPRYDEKQYLSMRAREKAWVREVLLLGNNEVCIFARSVFPKKTLQGKGRQLRYLQTKPLIEILANDPLLTRSEFEITTLHAANPAYHRAVGAAKIFPETLWQRRSVFHFYGQPLLVCETFLPTVLELKK